MNKLFIYICLLFIIIDNNLIINTNHVDYVQSKRIHFKDGNILSLTDQQFNHFIHAMINKEGLH